MYECPICKNDYKKIDKQHLMKKHGLSVEAYLEAYPDGPIGACPETKLKQGAEVRRRGPRSAETRKKISDSLQGVPTGRIAGTYITSEETKLKAVHLEEELLQGCW